MLALAAFVIKIPFFNKRIYVDTVGVGNLENKALSLRPVCF
jgi:hypothetical protein